MAQEKPRPDLIIPGADVDPEKVGLRALVPASVRAQRALAAVIAVVVVLLAAVIALGRGASEAAAGHRRGRLVPADALAYVHLSTDAKRPAVKRALALAARFPDYPLLRLALQARLGAITTASGTAAGLVDFARDIRPWLGKEAAVALLDTTSSAASSLIVLDVARPRRGPALSRSVSDRCDTSSSDSQQSSACPTAPSWRSSGTTW